MKLICTALIAAAAVLIPTAGAAPKALPKLTGTVGPGFTITLKRGTARVRMLKAGFYNLTVLDKASIHNFQIEGPGLDRAVTTVSFTGTKTVRIHLRRGTYKYYCAPHESSMFGNFKVT